MSAELLYEGPTCRKPIGSEREGRDLIRAYGGRMLRPGGTDAVICGEGWAVVPLPAVEWGCAHDAERLNDVGAVTVAPTEGKARQWAFNIGGFVVMWLRDERRWTLAPDPRRARLAERAL